MEKPKRKFIDSEGYEYFIREGKKELINKNVIKNWRN